MKCLKIRNRLYEIYNTLSGTNDRLLRKKMCNLIPLMEGGGAKEEMMGNNFPNLMTTPNPEI